MNDPTDIDSQFTAYLERSLEEIDVEDLKQFLRTLRNNCRDSSFQFDASNHPSIIDKCIQLIHKLSEISSSNITFLPCVHLAIQFLGNLTVNNMVSQEKIWDRLEQLKKLFSLSDEKARNFSAMLLYNAMLLRTEERCTSVSADIELMRTIVDDAKDGLEFAFFIIELILKNGQVKKLMALSTEHRLFVLEVLDSKLNENDFELKNSDIIYLSDRFKKTSDKILSTIAETVDRIEPWEVTKLSELLGKMSCKERYLMVLQEDTSLMINCSFLLRSLHEVGKASENAFSPVPRAPMANDPLPLHPALGFKSHLVRIIGNLCHRHRKLQDTLRETDCIAVLLECCVIDARNPFLMQWAILAIKNLCYGNSENQAYIAGMDRKESISPSLLEELGITLHIDDKNKVSLVPVSEKP